MSPLETHFFFVSKSLTVRYFALSRFRTEVLTHAQVQKIVLLSTGFIQDFFQFRLRDSLIVLERV